MDNMLLLMPFFKDYEKCLKEALGRKYCVTLVNCDLYNQRIVEKYHLIRRKMRHIYAIQTLRPGIDAWNKRMVCDSFNSFFMSMVSSQKNAYQAILCINCQCIGDGFLQTLRNNNPMSKIIYYLWDDICNLFRLPKVSSSVYTERPTRPL